MSKTHNMFVMASRWALTTGLHVQGRWQPCFGRLDPTGGTVRTGQLPGLISPVGL